MAGEIISKQTGQQAWQNLCRLDPSTDKILKTRALQIKAPAGHVVFKPGVACENYLFITTGSVRVEQLSEDGREIVLYRLGAGDTCIITTACLLSGDAYTAQAITETDVTAMAVPKAVFNQLLASSEAFRDLVFTTFGKRITGLMTVIEAVAFQRIEKRLSKRLLELTGPDHTVHRSHQQLATELGTAREVISRRLKAWEKSGWVKLERGRIALINRDALKTASEKP